MTHARASQRKRCGLAAPLGQKQTVQGVLFPNGICYRTDIGFFEPVTNELESMVFQGLLDLSLHGDAYKEQEIVNGGALCAILHRVAVLRACLKKLAVTS